MQWAYQEEQLLLNSIISFNINMMQTSKFQLSGLTCGACEKVVTKKLQTIEGLQEIHVSSQNGIAAVTAARLILKDEVEQVLVGTHYKVIKSL